MKKTLLQPAVCRAIAASVVVLCSVPAFGVLPHNNQFPPGSCPCCGLPLAMIDGGGGYAVGSVPAYTTAVAQVAPPRSMPTPSVAAAPAPAPAALSASPATSISDTINALAGTPAAKPKPSFPELKQRADGYWDVSFEHLASFAFAAPAADAKPKPGSVEQIPANVQHLGGKRVRVSGYMLPMKLERGFVTEFLIIRSPMVCCYGVVPQPNEWVVVKMSARAKKVPPLMDVPLNFYGMLHVGDVYEDNLFAGIYELDGEKVSVE